MSVLNHSSRANIVADALCRFFMGSMAHVQNDKKRRVQEVHQLNKLGIYLIDSVDGSFWVQNSLESSLVAKIKKKKKKAPQSSGGKGVSQRSKSRGLIQRGR